MKPGEEFLRLRSFARASQIRSRILMELHSLTSTPTDLEQKLDIKLSHVSRALGQLVDKGLAVCQNPDVTKGRYYGLTPAGAEVARFLRVAQNERKK